MMRSTTSSVRSYTLSAVKVLDGENMRELIMKMLNDIVEGAVDMSISVTSRLRRTGASRN